MLPPTIDTRVPYYIYISDKVYFLHSFKMCGLAGLSVKCTLKDFLNFFSFLFGSIKNNAYLCTWKR